MDKHYHNNEVKTKILKKDNMTPLKQTINKTPNIMITGNKLALEEKLKGIIAHGGRQRVNICAFLLPV